MATTHTVENENAQYRSDNLYALYRQWCGFGMPDDFVFIHAGTRHAATDDIARAQKCTSANLLTLYVHWNYAA